MIDYLNNSVVMRQTLIYVITILWQLPCYAQSDDSTFLRLYTEQYPPWNYSKNGEVSGLNTELIRQVMNKLSYRGRFEIMPWGRAQQFTQTQANTCFYSAVRTAEREALYQWVGPLSREYVQLFSVDSEHRKFSNLADASKLRIGGQTADAFTDYGVEQGLKIERIVEIPVNLAMLQLKRIDLWLAGSVGGPFIAAQEGIAIYPVVTSNRSFELWMACNLQVPDTVINNLNKTLELSKKDGTLDAIMQRYR